MPRKHYKSTMNTRKKRPGVTANRDIIQHLGRTKFTYLPMEVLRDALDTILGAMEDALAEGKPVKLAGFGTLKVVKGGTPKMVYPHGLLPGHPPVLSATKDRIKFIPSPELKARCNKKNPGQ